MELILTVFILITALALGVDSEGLEGPDQAPAIQLLAVEEVANEAPVDDVTVCPPTQRRIVQRNLMSDATDQ